MSLLPLGVGSCLGALGMADVSLLALVASVLLVQLRGRVMGFFRPSVRLDGIFIGLDQVPNFLPLVADRLRSCSCLVSPHSGLFCPAFGLDPPPLELHVPDTRRRTFKLGSPYDVIGPEALSYHDVAARLSAAMGREVRYIDVPDDAVRGALAGFGMPAWLVGALVDLYQDYRHSGTDGYAAQVTDTVQRLTDRPPRTFDQLLAEHTGRGDDSRLMRSHQAATLARRMSYKSTEWSS